MIENDNLTTDKKVKIDNVPYKINDCDQSFFVERANEFAQLCRDAFAEHKEKNVNMGPCYMTAEKWVEHSKDCIGQYVEKNGRIIAFWMARANFNTKEAYGRILAVAPSYKGMHLGLQLTRSRSEYLRRIGMHVYITDTSLKAPHVVKFHKSYGSKAVGMTSWPNTNYYTVILRLALFPEYEISDKEARRRFFLSKIKCMMLLREDGSSTLFGKFYNSMAKLRRKFRYWIVKH